MSKSPKQPKQELHYLAKAVIKAIQQNHNSDCAIHDLFQPAPDPISIENPEIQAQIDKLFKSGCELIAHTTVGDDIGWDGPCYSAYLVKPEWVQHYNHYINTMLLARTSFYPYNLLQLKYALDFPENCLQIWAGVH